MEALECILTRRSIRKYSECSISKEQIAKLLDAGAAAPSAANQQPWHFIVIDNRELLNGITKIHPYSQMLKTAPIAIAIAFDNSKKHYPELVIDDLSACAENVLLAAHALGLGAVWIGVHFKEEYQKGIKSLLNLPESVNIASIISVGHADEARTPRTYLKPEMVHKNGW